MKRKLTVLILAIISLSAYSGTLPEKVDLMKYSKKTSGMYGFPTFRAAGWSADGKFAYITHRESEGRGGTVYRYVILDAVRDKVVWELEHDTFNSETGKITNYDFNREPGLSHLREFQKQLKHFNIQSGKGTNFQSFPLKHNGNTYTATAFSVPEENGQFWDKIKSFRVLIEAQNKGRKQITSDNDVKAHSYWIAGYFKSPFEPRILVVIGEEKFVFEGTEAFFRFSGSHLQAGFK
jgi:hypothetical protein